MKIEDWERIDHSKNNIEWRHDSGIRIILSKQANYYVLSLYDASGIEHHTTSDYNKSKMEALAAKWQRQYNTHLRRLS